MASGMESIFTWLKMNNLDHDLNNDNNTRLVSLKQTSF
jgi:hypothetical protein